MRRRGLPSRVASAEISRDPSSWKEEEAFLRTGTWSGFLQGDWQPSPLGGSDVFRTLRRYAADEQSYGTQAICTKHKPRTKKLIPGCFLFWCKCCSKCVFFSLMGDAESPRTVFEVLYARRAQPPHTFCLDNGCNLHQYLLNREPAFFETMRVFIDEPHYRGHKQCSQAYNTGMGRVLGLLSLLISLYALCGNMWLYVCRLAASSMGCYNGSYACVCTANYRDQFNSPLPEQKNRFIRKLEAQVAYMKQTTLLWYLRYFLYRLNKLQDQSAQQEVFYRRAAATTNMYNM